MLGWADHYGAEEGVDFNLQPTAEFENAPLGGRLAKMAYRLPAFDPFRERFKRSLHLFDYGASDGIMDECLRGGIVAQAGRSIYGDWRRYAEMLEGLNVALFRAAAAATKLRRFILDLGKLGNYQNGSWRRDGDGQDRVSTTVGSSNFHLDKMAVAVVTYDAVSSVAGRSLSATRRTLATPTLGWSGSDARRTVSLPARARSMSTRDARSRRAATLK